MLARQLGWTVNALAAPFSSNRPANTLTEPGQKVDGAHLKYLDTDTLVVTIPMRQRAAYPQSFKAQVVQEYLQLGVSMPSVPSRYGIYRTPALRAMVSAYF